MPRTSNQQSLKEVIDELISAYRLRQGLNQAKLRESWESLMGKPIASKTTSITLDKDIVIVRLSSSVLRQELLYKRQDIADALNEVLGREVVKEVRFL